MNVLMGILIGSICVMAQPFVELTTSLGAITIELNEEKAPDTVQNFLAYVESGFYDGTIFHRVIDNFMIQGGGFTEDMTKKDTKPPIRNEANNGLSNVVGTIAMARTSDPNSATAQFFINVANNLYLNYQSKDRPGYCVFGRVVEGMSVVQAIKKQPVETKGMHQNVPTEPIQIIRARVVEDPDSKQQSNEKNLPLPEES